MRLMRDWAARLLAAAALAGLAELIVSGAFAPRPHESGITVCIDHAGGAPGVVAECWSR